MDGPQQEVRQFVNSSNAPRRVFTLGIGNDVSTAMCEGIARAGNGECLLAVDTESIIEKCIKLFTASRTPFVRSVTLDWGIPSVGNLAGSPGVTFSNHPSPRSVATRPLPELQQTPHKIEAMHSGTRLNIFAIVTSRNARPPKTVILSGVLDDETNSPFELKVQVQQIALVQSEDDTIPILHTMAAWKLIQEYSDNPTIPLPRPLGVATEDELRQSVIVQLGIMYQIASRHTSFIAVVGGRDHRLGRRLKQGFLHQFPEYVDHQDADSDPSLHGPLEIAQHQLRNVWSSMTSALVALASLWANSRTTGQAFTEPSSPNGSTETLPGTYPQVDSVPGQTPAGIDDTAPTDYDSQNDSERSSMKTFSTLSSLDGWSRASSSDWSSLYSDRSNSSYQRAPSPTFRRRQQQPGTPKRDSRGLESRLPTVVELIKSQQHDGSFSQGVVRNLLPLVGKPAVEETHKLAAAEREVWTTVLCIAYLKKELEESPDLLENLLVKPLEYLMGKHGVDIDALLERAAQLLQ